MAANLIGLYSLEELVSVYNHSVLGLGKIPVSLDFLLRIDSVKEPQTALRDYILGCEESGRVREFIYSLDVLTPCKPVWGGETQALTELLGFSVVTSQNLKVLHDFSGGNLLHLAITSGSRVVLVNRQLQRANLGVPTLHSAIESVKVLSQCLFLV